MADFVTEWKLMYRNISTLSILKYEDSGHDLKSRWAEYAGSICRNAETAANDLRAALPQADNVKSDRPFDSIDAFDLFVREMELANVACLHTFRQIGGELPKTQSKRPQAPSIGDGSSAEESEPSKGGYFSRLWQRVFGKPDHKKAINARLSNYKTIMKSLKELFDKLLPDWAKALATLTEELIDLAKGSSD